MKNYGLDTKREEEEEEDGGRDRASGDTAASTVEDSHSLLTTAESLISCSLLNPLFVDNSISCQRK